MQSPIIIILPKGKHGSIAIRHYLSAANVRSDGIAENLHKTRKQNKLHKEQRMIALFFDKKIGQSKKQNEHSWRTLNA